MRGLRSASLKPASVDAFAHQPTDVLFVGELEDRCGEGHSETERVVTLRGQWHYGRDLW